MLKGLSSKDFKIVNWKNGGGLTEELIVFPQAEDFKWRMSVATIHSSGPFSSFTGYRRILVLLSGEIAIKHDHEIEINLKPLSPHIFEGDSKTECRLISESSRDFNLIFDPEFAECKLKCSNAKRGELISFKEAPDFIYVAEGRLKLKAKAPEVESETLERHCLYPFEEWSQGFDLESIEESEAQVIAIEIHQKSIDFNKF